MLRIERPFKMLLHGCCRFDVDGDHVEFLRRVGHTRIPFWCNSVRVHENHITCDFWERRFHPECAPEVKQCVRTFAIAMNRSRPLTDPASEKTQAVLPRLPPELLTMIMWFYELPDPLLLLVPTKRRPWPPPERRRRW